MLKKYYKFMIIIIVIDLFLFPILYINLIKPFLKKNNCNYDGSIIYYYRQSINSLEYMSIIEDVIDKDIKIDNFVKLDDTAFLSISRNERHRRVVGQILIKGTYENAEDIENFFKSFNIVMEERKKIFFINSVNNTSIYLYLKSNNEIEIIVKTNLPYDISDMKNNYNTIDNYYENKILNEMEVIKNSLSKLYFVILILILVIDIIIVIIIKLSFFSKFNNLVD